MFNLLKNCQAPLQSSCTTLHFLRPACELSDAPASLPTLVLISFPLQTSQGARSHLTMPPDPDARVVTTFHLCLPPPFASNQFTEVQLNSYGFLGPPVTVTSPNSAHATPGLASTYNPCRPSFWAYFCFLPPARLRAP